MHVALADVFMYGIVGDVAHAVARPIAFRVESLCVVVHAGEQRVARLGLVLAGKPRIGQCRLKLRAIFSGSRQGVL